MGNSDDAGRVARANSEQARLTTLSRLEILDTPSEREFDTIVQAAQQIFDCKIALISLVDGDRQWFKARCGLDVDQTPRGVAFCAHAVHADDVLIVTDATLDARFAANPLVTGAPSIRFYAGVPVRACDPSDPAVRRPIGTLCVIDDRPRHPDAGQMALLRNLAHLVETLLGVRSSAAEASRLAAERGAALHKLDRAHRQFRQAERMANMGSWRLTLADNRTEWSEQTYALHGLPVGDGKGLESALDFYPLAARSIIKAAVERAIATGEPFDVETDFVTAQGEPRRVRSMGEPELVDGIPVALIGVFQDITSRHALKEALRQAAATDELTSIASRGHFNEVADKRIARARADDEPLALLLIDLDHFKAVNDRCGHLAGDDLLRLMAARLQAPYLAGSLAGRLGGDEFVLLLNSRQTLSDLPGLVRRLLADLRHSVSKDGAIIDVSATIGACWLDDSVAGRSELVERADVALYRAKNARRGSAMIFGRDGVIEPGQDPQPQLRVIH